jgi:predicted transcriptional regulator
LPGAIPKEVTAERERKAWKLRQKCWTEARIAEELDLTQQAVSAILRRVEKRLSAQFQSRAEEIKAAQTAQLEYLADQALQAWERSQEDAEGARTVTEAVELKTNEETLDDENTPIRRKQVLVPAEKITTTRTSEGQSGDPRFLAEARNALSEIRDIWGLNAPKKTDVLSGGQTLTAIGYRITPPEMSAPDDDGTGETAPERGG